MVIPQPKEGEILHGLCIHLPSFSSRMGSWCWSREVQWGQLCLPKSPSTTSLSLYLVFKYFPIVRKSLSGSQEAGSSSSGLAESQCSVLTAQARTKPQRVCVRVPAGDL